MGALLEAGADVDVQDNKGMCPLHWAVHRAHLDTVRLLLGAKAYPNNIGSLKLEESEEVALNIIHAHPSLFAPGPADPP